ncbi:hypothetical protein VTH82DRAFT_6695 [Thermothelomyces myriococcoides]
MEGPARAQTLPQPGSDRKGGEIYLHLEFRVSWGGKKQQSPKSHQITFRSRGSKERTPAFPRQVPAPNTNYLAAIHDFEQRQMRLREMRQNANHTNPNRHHQMQEYYQQGNQSGSQLQVPVIQEPERQTRADVRSSHERGRSAPPPFGENPWDVSVPDAPARNAGVPPDSRRMAEIRRKPLPAPPTQFRLGEGQPWSSWCLPDRYDPDADPKDEEDGRGYEDLPAVVPPADRNSTTFATNPTMVSTFSPGGPATLPPDPELSSLERLRDVETGRTRELGALSAAMMTVDNGFENQWWYQGRRDTVIDPDVSRVAAAATTTTTTTTTAPNSRFDGTVSALASPIDSPQLPAGVVSPLSDNAFSPAQVPASLLQRTLSTRSEEFWFREKTF